MKKTIKKISFFILLFSVLGINNYSFAGKIEDLQERLAAQKGGIKFGASPTGHGYIKVPVKKGQRKKVEKKEFKKPKGQAGRRPPTKRKPAQIRKSIENLEELKDDTEETKDAIKEKLETENLSEKEREKEKEKLKEVKKIEAGIAEEIDKAEDELSWWQYFMSYFWWMQGNQ